MTSLGTKNLLSKIRNAQTALRVQVDNVPYSIGNVKLLQNLYFRGYIRGYYRVPNSMTITVLLKTYKGGPTLAEA